MLHLFERLAARLGLLRPVSLITAVIGLLLLAASLFVADFQHWLMPGFLLFLWSLLGYSFLTLFRSLPAPPSAQEGLFARWKGKLVRGAYWLLALAFLLLTLGVLGMTLRGLVIFFSG
ncbi:hypothetical protein [Marinospirillum sp.]|uniref:hypothetical protein n=1 Tax=Marinospirillum sp. TaxID=2183934 RepID=UPI003850F46F